MNADQKFLVIAVNQVASRANLDFSTKLIERCLISLNCSDVAENSIHQTFHSWIVRLKNGCTPERIRV